MMVVKRVFLAVIVFAFFLAVFSVDEGVADDGDLTFDGVASFLAVQKKMYPIDDELRAVGEYSIFRPKSIELARPGQPAYQVNVVRVKENQPEFYTRFEDIAINFTDKNDQKPFASLEDWVKMGDRVMTAFYAANTDQVDETKSRLQNSIPPEAMAMMQSIPEAKKIIDDAIGALDTMEDVPESDRKIVQNFSKEIIFHVNHVKGESGYAVSE